MKTISLLGGLTVSASVAVAALAHTGASGVVKQRMDAMGELAAASKVLAGIVGKDTPYDAATVRTQAQVLQKHSGSAMTALFPSGSITGPSEATPAIWQDWTEFAAVANRLEVLADGLVLAADIGIDGGARAPIPPGALPADIGRFSVDTVFAAIAETCKACHADYRVKK